MPLPDFEAWAVFAKVAELGSFSRTAAELGLSKATVSKMLTRLEVRLGTPLLHRSSRRVALTESGRAALDRAQRILQEGEAVEAEVTEQVQDPRGLVRITAPLSFGIRNLGPILPMFLHRYPRVTLDLQLTDRRVDLLAERIDVALRIGILQDSALRARQLYPVRRVLVAAPAYVAQHGAPVHPGELEGHHALLFTQAASMGVWQFHHPVQGECSVRVSGQLRTDNGDVMMPALLAGAGVAVMPDFLVWQDLQGGGLVELLPGWSMRDVALHVVTPPGALRPARVTVLIDFLAEHVRRASWRSKMAGPGPGPGSGPGPGPGSGPQRGRGKGLGDDVP